MLLLAGLALFIQPDTDLISANKPQFGVSKIKAESLKSKTKFPEWNFSMPAIHKTPEAKELEYVHKVQKRELKAKYEKSLLPFSGYQTKAEYEEASKVKDKSRNNDTEFKPVLQDKDMIYVPQPKYKLVRYNDPPGNPEISLGRKYKFDRSETSFGVISNDLSLMVYPEVYYYADRNITTGDVFVLPLDKTLPDIQRILKANVARRWQNPILSTDKSTDVRDVFRTMTPIDFSVDGTKLVAKEKIGNNFDGIWQTNLWVYDFKTKKATKIVEVREAILYYWQKVRGYNLEEYRWDIYPLGFDKKFPNRIIVNAYAYTGKKPRFLGAWSVDYNGEASKLESLRDQTLPVSVIGFKLKQDGVKDPAVVKAETKHLKDVHKITKKAEKKAKKLEKKAKKDAYKAQLKEFEKEYREQMKKLMEKPDYKGVPTS